MAASSYSVLHESVIAKTAGASERSNQYIIVRISDECRSLSPVLTMAAAE